MLFLPEDDLTRRCAFVNCENFQLRVEKRLGEETQISKEKLEKRTPESGYQHKDKHVLLLTLN